MKLKVLELSTGKTKVEEWTFLPANWDYHGLLTVPIFDKNFVFMHFHTWSNLSTDTDDILIMNLVTRTKFWMRSGTLTAQVKEKAAGRIDLEDFRARKLYASAMNVEKDRIVVKIKLQEYIRSTFGWFSNPYITYIICITYHMYVTYLNM